MNFDDLKVIGANTLCMIMLRVENVNASLQTVLILLTIGYTIVRTINEIKKLKHKKYGEADSGVSSQD